MNKSLSSWIPNLASWIRTTIAGYDKSLCRSIRLFGTITIHRPFYVYEDCIGFCMSLLTIKHSGMMLDKHRRTVMLRP